MNQLLSSGFQIMIISLAVSAISMTLAKSELFEPLRNNITEQSEWLGKLVNCPYCTSHWVAIAFVAIYQPSPFRVIVVDQVMVVFALVTLASFWSGLIYRAYQPME